MVTWGYFLPIYVTAQSYISTKIIIRIVIFRFRKFYVSLLNNVSKFQEQCFGIAWKHLPQSGVQSDLEVELAAIGTSSLFTRQASSRKPLNILTILQFISQCNNVSVNSLSPSQVAVSSLL